MLSGALEGECRKEALLVRPRMHYVYASLAIAEVMNHIPCQAHGARLIDLDHLYLTRANELEWVAAGLIHPIEIAQRVGCCGMGREQQEDGCK
jgi:hypothetical protein